MAIESANNNTALQKSIFDQIKETTSDRNTGELGKDDFLNLLVTQLRYQDPLKPMEDKEFISQMAQFSSLEQMQNLNNSFTSVKAFSMIDKYITASIQDEESSEPQIVQGEVTSVKISSGKAYVVVNGQDISVDNITDVSENQRSDFSDISKYTNLIGYDAKGSIYDSKTGDIIDVTGTVAQIKRGVYEDYAVMDNLELEVSSLDELESLSDMDAVKNYLDSKIGTEVSVTAVDTKNNKSVPVTARLDSYTYSDGKLKLVLDGVDVPVESISNIMPSK